MTDILLISCYVFMEAVILIDTFLSIKNKKASKPL